MDIETLRGELKVWERAFVDANGRRPGRDDIKSNAAIAAKYKQYDQSRRIPPPFLTQATATTPKKNKRNQDSTHDRRPLRERPANVPAATPQKSRVDADKPLLIAQEDIATPAYIRRALGPTPQKDGHVLSIFDMLPSISPSRPAETPSKRTQAPVSGTPSKQPAPSSSEQALSRTPVSSGKRAFFDAFINGTPLKRKRADTDLGTPSTVKRQFATPLFLRRTMTTIEEAQEDRASHAPPFKRRSLVRSLSSIIQGLKKQEEQRMDDEWDILNDLEAETNGEKRQISPARPTVLVEDSQAVAEMPLGPDQGAAEDNSDDEVDPGALGPDGQPRKVWKKKGLKRQTKRVKMKPVLHKPQKAANLEEEGHIEEEPELVEKTTPCNGDADAANARAVPRGRTASTIKANKVDLAESGKASGGTKKSSKKLNSLAHTNFRKLKIKSKNSKPKGRGGRFGRR